MWDTMFNRVQPVFNQFEAGKATYGQIWPKMAKNGRFGGPLRPPRVILVSSKGSKWPPQMWATMFNHDQPVFNQFGAARAAYGQIRPNMARNGRFGGPLRHPRVILVGAKVSKWPILDVGYDVQPCSTSVQPIWGS